MKRTKISDIFDPALIGSEVDVKGWVRTRRGNKNVQFVALNDGSTVRNLQIVFDLSRFSDEELKAVTTGSSIHVTGQLVESMGKGQTCEVQADTLEIYGTADPETYPCRRKDIQWSSCAKRLTCVLVPLLSALSCASVAPSLSLSTSSSTTKVSSICTLPHHRQ